MNEDMYGFLLNMWVMNRIGIDYLDVMVEKGFLEEDEKEMIVAMVQI